MTATVQTKPRAEFDLDVEERLDRHDDDAYAGWWCVATAPFPCPAEGCSFVAVYATAAHRIVVWPAGDDPRLLRHAAHMRDVGRDPRVVEYERGLGPCISFDGWEAIGRPVHAVGSHPNRTGW